MVMPHQANAASLSGPTEAAHALARTLPRLALEARRVAFAAQTGIHGRRKAGTGETFWQFRPYLQGEAAHRIDWRRSGRDGTLSVREHEWEAAHTVWLWFDQSPSMAFSSPWAMEEKGNQAVILGLAIADLLVRGGERVGHWQNGRTSQQRGIIDHLALMLIESAAQPAELPAPRKLERLHEIILLTDGLSLQSDWSETIDSLAQNGARGHFVLIRDPAEITLPYEGQCRLQATEQGAQLEIGDAAAFRPRYQNRIKAHDEGLRQVCARHQWSFHAHQTDKPLAPLLLALAGHILNRPFNRARHG